METDEGVNKARVYHKRRDALNVSREERRALKVMLFWEAHPSHGQMQSA